LSKKLETLEESNKIDLQKQKIGIQVRETKRIAKLSQQQISLSEINSTLEKELETLKETKGTNDRAAIQKLEEHHKKQKEDLSYEESLQIQKDYRKIIENAKSIID